MPFVAHRAFNWQPVQIDESWGLKTIQLGNAYSICNTLECTLCGCLFVDIRFSDVELNNLYKDYRGHEYTELREKYEPGYKERNKTLLSGINYIAEIEHFLRPFAGEIPSLLDWGGDTGKNTPFSGSKIRHVYDITPRSTVEGVKFVDKNSAALEEYDLIICNNVLEHTPFPIEILNEIRKFMKEHTVLYIEVPKENIFREHSGDYYLFKRHWHEHVNFFTIESLIQLCGNAGFEVLKYNEIYKTQESNSLSALQIACKLKAAN